MATIRIESFTDPSCPFAWSAEPALTALRWRYAGAVELVSRAIVLSEHPDDYLARGFGPEEQLAGHAAIQERYGMPMLVVRRPRMLASVVPCRAFVAVREHEPELAERFLRALRVVFFVEGALIDEPPALARAAHDVGLDPSVLRRWMDSAATDRALRADMAAARAPLPAARTLSHKLSGPDDAPRYSAPTLVLRHVEEGTTFVLPGFQPVEAYDALIANLAPGIERRPAPEDVSELLDWAPWPLSTREVATVCELSPEEAREALEGVAGEQEAGAESLWWRRRAALRVTA